MNTTDTTTPPSAPIKATTPVPPTFRYQLDLYQNASGEFYFRAYRTKKTLWGLRTEKIYVSDWTGGYTCFGNRDSVMAAIKSDADRARKNLPYSIVVSEEVIS